MNVFILFQISFENMNKLDSVYGLLENRQQAIIWTNADPLHWCIYRNIPI